MDLEICSISYNMLNILEIKEDLQVNLLSNKASYSNDIISLVDSIWDLECEKNKKVLFNGKIFSVHDINANKISGYESGYKFFLAQQKKPDLYDSLSIKPLAVSGLLETSDGIFIFGKRAGCLTQHPSSWELVPSGGIDLELCLFDGCIDYKKQVVSELHEEIGLTKDQISSITPFLMIDDAVSHVLDIVLHLKTSMSFSELEALFLKSEVKEYTNIRGINANNVELFFKNNSVVDASVKIFEFWSSRAK